MDVMLDLETMGLTPDAAIVAIGAVEFDITTKSLGRKFYAAVDLESSVTNGGVMDPSTVMWWVQQGVAARAALSMDTVPLPVALGYFSKWIREGEGEEPYQVKVWGNGAAFDNVVLASAYRNTGLRQPQKFWNDRCYRTVKAQYPDVPMVRDGTHHNALDDAVSQAKHMIQMLGVDGE